MADELLFDSRLGTMRYKTIPISLPERVGFLLWRNVTNKRVESLSRESEVKSMSGPLP